MTVRIGNSNGFHYSEKNCNQRLYIVDDGVQLKPNKKV